MSRLLALVALLALTAAAAPTAAQSLPPAAYDGLKKTVSVDKFLAAEAVGGTVTSDGMTAMLTDALIKDGRFQVVEPPAATVVGAPQTGDVVPVSAIVRGTVTKYEPAAGGGGVSLGGLPMGRLLGATAGIKSQTAVMEISLHIVDSSTGSILASSKAQGTASSSGVDATLVNSRTGAASTAGTFMATPIGKAGEAAIAKAVEQIAIDMRRVPWSALVVDASDGKVYVNAGADRNVQAGMILHAYRRGKVFKDPASGQVLDVELTPLGVIQIDGVRDRMSTAVMVSGEAPQQGDLLKLN
jgi:curli biogenesis system outer membrane secretion channel CsgG